MQTPYRSEGPYSGCVTDADNPPEIADRPADELTEARLAESDAQIAFEFARTVAMIVVAVVVFLAAFQSSFGIAIDQSRDRRFSDWLSDQRSLSLRAADTTIALTECNARMSESFAQAKENFEALSAVADPIRKSGREPTAAERREIEEVLKSLQTPVSYRDVCARANAMSKEAERAERSRQDAPAFRHRPWFYWLGLIGIPLLGSLSMFMMVHDRAKALRSAREKLYRLEAADRMSR